MKQILGFLASHPPFDSLGDDDLARVSSAVEIEYFPEGSTILEQGEAPPTHAYVVRKGAVELLDRDRSIDVLGEGEIFGAPSLLSGLPVSLGVRTLEDTICYLIDVQHANEVFASAGGVRFLTLSLLRRRERATEADRAASIEAPTSVGSLVHRAPVVCEPGRSIRGAATMMADARISSVLVEEEGKIVGIVTDRDIRSRVVAAGLPTDEPVGAVMSSPLITVSSTVSIDEVLLLMLDDGIHHAVVADREDRIVGVVTDTDLLAVSRTHALQLHRSIARAATAELAIAEASRLPELVVSLVSGDMDPTHIGRTVSITLDVLTRRLLQFATEELGHPPAAWAWVALGSHARREQALLTDQDHALAIEGAGPGEPDDQNAVGDLASVDRYFERLARAVADGLAASGIARCRGGVMAENSAWRLSRPEWRSQFQSMLRDPSPTGRLFTNVALDYRRLAGPLDIEATIDAAILSVHAEASVARRLASTAVAAHPPTGFFGSLVLDGRGAHAGTFDVKHAGILPVTNLARAYSVAHGLVLSGTIDRLRGLSASGLLEADRAAVLEEAFRLLWRIRLRHQAAAIERGESPNDHVDLRSLTPVTRRALKQAFREIASAQQLLRRELQLWV